MNYKQAEQRLKELLSTGFMVEVKNNYDTSIEVEKLLYKLYKKDSSLFKVAEVWDEGVFEQNGLGFCGLSAGYYNYFGVDGEGKTWVDDYSKFPTLNEDELREIVEAFTSEDAVDNKFEAVSGDQSLFDLVEATDECLYILLAKDTPGVYGITQEHMETGLYSSNKILAERKLKEPEFSSYHTEHYPHEDYEGKVYAFRARTGEAAINFIDGDYSGEVVLTPENTIKFANELIALANGVERKDWK